VSAPKTSLPGKKNREKRTCGSDHFRRVRSNNKKEEKRLNLEKGRKGVGKRRTPRRSRRIGGGTVSRTKQEKRLKEKRPP